MSLSYSSPNILIVEDEWIIALDIKQCLNKLGYQVVGTANCAEKAIYIIAETKPDLVLMDIYLQGEINGIELARLINQQFHIPVVFLTAHADEATLKEAITAHPQGYVIKPFEEKDLSVAIQIALANHRAEKFMQQALDREKELNELKSQFVSIVSHELRNPLSSLLLTLEILEKHVPFPENQISRIQRAKNSVKEMNQLITDILVVGEIEREQFCYEPVSLDINRFCSNLVEEVQSRHESTHCLSFTAEYPENQILWYELDPKLLEHILINLLENAIKYSPRGSEVSLNICCEPNSIKFQIRDQGIGLTTEDQKNLFTPFYRGSNVGNIRGTGLGLAIVKTCVNAHSGEITVESEVGVGSVFTVTLYCQQTAVSL